MHTVQAMHMILQFANKQDATGLWAAGLGSETTTMLCDVMSIVVYIHFAASN